MIIGFTGRKGSGKDTAAAVLKKSHTNVKMAGGLKTMLAAFLAYQGVDGETVERMIEGDLKEVPSPYLAGRTPRYAMQTLGTEWGRDLMGEKLWTSSFDHAASRYDNVVCTDIRFPNEARHVDFLVKIERPGVDTSDAHPSEALIDTLQADVVIVNDCSSADEFKDKVSRQLLLTSPRSSVH